eukprot:3706338-Alexandrium_andersonii.AAC.1
MQEASRSELGCMRLQAFGARAACASRRPACRSRPRKRSGLGQQRSKRPACRNRPRKRSELGLQRGRRPACRNRPLMQGLRV